MDVRVELWSVASCSPRKGWLPARRKCVCEEKAAYYGPAREVGGDFYDFLEFPDGRLGLVVGDATGHGMPAALVMATTRGMLRAVVQSLESPGEVLAGVNEALVADIPPARL